MRKKRIFPIIYIAFVLLFLYLPIFLVIIYSFNDSKSSAVWQGFTFSWYALLFKDRDLLDSLGVSLELMLYSTFFATIIGTLGAISLKNLHKWLKTIITGLSLAPLIVPEIVLAVALLMFFSVAHIDYGMTTLVISHTIFCAPYVLFMVQVRLLSIDKSIYEAAKDLGAKPFQLFYTITLPLIAPAIVSGALLSATMSLDDVVISFFVKGPGSNPLPVKIFSLLRLGITPKINALCTLMLFITFIVLGVAVIMQTKNQEEKEEKGDII